MNITSLSSEPAGRSSGSPARFRLQRFSFPPPNGSSQHRWLVSYADMLTLLFALFLILFALSQSHPEKLPKLAGAISKAQGNVSVVPLAPQPPVHPSPGVETIVITDIVGEPTPSPAPAPAPAGPPVPDRREQRENLGQELRDRLGTVLGDLGEVRLEERGVVVALLDSPLLFDSGDCAIHPKGQEILKKICAVAEERRLPLRIEGHTDNVPIHTVQFPSNWELSVSRASAVARALIADGLDPETLSVMGYGSVRPRFSNTDETHRSQNRRVEIVFLCGATMPAPAPEKI